MSADHHDQLDTVDEFEEFDHEEFAEDPLPPPKGFKDRMMEMWRDNPGFKMLVILGVGAFVLVIAFMFMNSSGKDASELNPSRVSGSNSAVKGTPGADVSAEYKKVLDESNKKAAEQALQTGTSAIPTPVGNVVDSGPAKKEEPIDPLAMWRAAEQKPPAPAPQPAPVQQQQQQQQVNQQQQQQEQQQQQQIAAQQQQLAEAMKTQIQSLMQAWGPTQATVVTFTQPASKTNPAVTTNTSTNLNSTIANNGGGADVINATGTTANGGIPTTGLPTSLPPTGGPYAGVGSGTINGAPILSTNTSVTTTAPGNTSTITQAAQTRAKVIVPAGDIDYGTLITEANSDVPGPILAQILSGPLKGGRLIGSFTDASDSYLVIKFSTLSIYGHSYPVDAIALDPNTTLGGMATETDGRYFERLVLPAAASFVSQFGSAISTPPTSTSVSNGTVVTSTQPSSTTTALYAGMGNAAQQVSTFMNAQGNQVKPLVRVASNTAIGIFFTKAVTDQPNDGQ